MPLFQACSNRGSQIHVRKLACPCGHVFVKASCLPLKQYVTSAGTASFADTNTNYQLPALNFEIHHNDVILHLICLTSVRSRLTSFLGCSFIDCDCINCAEGLAHLCFSLLSYFANPNGLNYNRMLSRKWIITQLFNI